MTQGQLLGANLFAYCTNNPVNMVDSDGYRAKSIVGISILGVLALAIAGTPVGWIGAFVILCGVAVYGAYALASKPKTITVKMSQKINWDGDKNHIINGSKSSKDNHLPGWKKFGFDPNGKGGWAKLLVILQAVVDTGNKYKEEMTKGGEKLLYYSKYYAKEGVEVIVRIWQSADGLRQQISDA